MLGGAGGGGLVGGWGGGVGRGKAGGLGICHVGAPCTAPGDFQRIHRRDLEDKTGRGGGGEGVKGGEKSQAVF